MFVNFLYQGLYEILTLLLPFITIPYISRVLGTEGIGLYSYSYAVASYFITFANLAFIPIYGAKGVAFGTVIAEGSVFFIQVWIIRKEIEAYLYDMSPLFVLFIQMLTGIIIYVALSGIMITFRLVKRN